jgi:hypothetical protein
MLELAIDGDGSEWEQVGTYVFLVLTFCGAGAQVKKTNLGQLQPFTAVFPRGCVGQLASSGPA